MPDERSDEELMRAYVSGDQEAFREIFGRYAPVVLGMARRQLRGDDEAREVVQQTFFQLHAARNDFREGSRLRPWLITIGMNLVRDRFRGRKRRPTTELKPEAHAAEVPERGRIELQQRAAAVRRAMSALPDTQREVVELHWFQELPFAEVARQVGSSEGAVRVRAHRAYNRLREVLAGELE